MAVVKASSADVDLMARLLRAEAEGEGKQGMLLVGNVGINRVRANCSDFKGLRTIRQMVFQPHAFEAVTHGYFYQRPRESERRLARRNINGERFWPAKFSRLNLAGQNRSPLMFLRASLRSDSRGLW